MIVAKAVIFALLSLLSASLVVSLKDFESCDIGKGKVRTPLWNLANNSPKPNEVFRFKWYHHKRYPYFTASFGNRSNIIEISMKSKFGWHFLNIVQFTENEGDSLKIYYAGAVCDSIPNASSVLSIPHYTESEVIFKKGNFDFIR